MQSDSSSTTIAEGKESDTISPSYSSHCSNDNAISPNGNELQPSKKDWIIAMIEREAIPKPERTDTVEEFCTKHDISPSTYNYQKRQKENKKKIVDIWLSEAIEGGNSVLKKLKENADKGKEKSIEMYLKFILELAENLDIKSDGQALSIRFSNLYNGLPRTTSETSGDHSVKGEIQSN